MNESFEEESLEELNKNPCPFKRHNDHTKFNEDITKNDLKEIAPYLWERRVKKSTRDNVTEEHLRSILIQQNDFSMELVNMGQLPQRLLSTANLLKQLTKSSGVNVYLVDKVYNEIYFCSSEALESDHRITWKIRTGHTIAAHVAFSKQCVMANRLFSDDRFPEGTGWGKTTLTSVICAPILSRNAECSAVIELYRDDFIDYVQLNQDLVMLVCGWMGSAIEQHQKRILLELREDINTKLMSLMQRFISNTNRFDEVLSEILFTAKSSINAQRATFYLLNATSGKLKTKIYDETLLEPPNAIVMKKLTKKLKGFAYMAVESGKLVNLNDAYKDPRFDKTIDQKAGFLTRSVLCMPILDHDGCTGVIQIVNKLPGGVFTETDRDLFNIFGTYCANIVNYKNQYDAGQKSVNFNHMYRTLMEDRIFELVTIPMVPTDVREVPEDIDSFSFYPYPNYMDDMVDLSIFMITDIMGTDFFDQRSLHFFIWSVNKMYRPIPYHNFEHAFAFLNCEYCILKREGHRFTPVEKLALMFAGLCHDVDHPGYTNVFLRMSKHPLASLYEDSILENHHIFVGKLLLQKSDVLKMLDKDTMATFMTLFRENILSTDLKVYLIEHRPALLALCGPDKPHTFDWKNEIHRSLLQKLIMTTADMNALSKPYSVSIRVSTNVASEFYMQGDEEIKIGITPTPNMDRSMGYKLPEWQLIFMGFLALPCFELIKNVLPSTSALYTNGKILKKAWLEILKTRGQETWNPQSSLPK